MFSLGPDTDKLVSYYSATHWAGRLPAQGWVYLTVDHLAFYAFLLGVETKVAKHTWNESKVITIHCQLFRCW